MTLLASSAGRSLERQATKRLEEWLSTTEPGLSASFTLFTVQLRQVVEARPSGGRKPGQARLLSNALRV